MGGVAGLGCQRNSDEVISSPHRSGNHPPEIRAASILPSPLILNGPISVAIEALDLDRNPLSFRYQWDINGRPVPSEHGEQLRPEFLKRGDQVSARIWPHDGTVEGAPFTTSTVVVVNSPPIVTSLVVEPDVLIPGMNARAHAEVRDVDYDLTHVTYRWWKNQSLLQEGEGTEFDTTQLAAGDTLSVEAVASDGAGSGAPVRSAPIRIGNTAPRIVSTPITALDRGVFTYQLEAHDAESDALTFSLETAPPGMTIDGRQGLVTWQIPPGKNGKYKVRILVKDSRGAASFQEFDLQVTGVAPPAPSQTFRHDGTALLVHG